MVYLPSIAAFAVLFGAAPLSGSAEVARSSKLHQAARRSLGASLVDELRKKWGLVTRVPYKHTVTSDNVLSATRLSSEANLTMELDQGMPSVRGEYVRSTISEDQSGVHTFVDLELIDISTYETASDLYIDFWHCKVRLDRTFLRGIQPTNEEGQASFETIFPGHSSGHATHFDTVIQSQGTVFGNGTFTAPSMHYIGK
ncbi:hypothetical protein ARMSODRAFT_978914 [Armillaria solidipes]|uniref:Aromatic compound dioxygenase n=1 Tax=Armillaria solidipes TaxID=1076256 RepID=A0A2H3B162_9AGAR|nr:hypothetical protein ARMSODRAFT_978914 [Armillaria solidipes]